MGYKYVPTAFLISIGRELLRGITQDCDAHYLAQNLTENGICVSKIIVVDDDSSAIGQAIHEALHQRPRIIITTGGLGPTFDDITLAALAKALKKPLILHPTALQQLKTYYAEMQKKGVVNSAAINAPRKKMALLPHGSRPLFNRKGAAPGVQMQVRQSLIFCLPGVPAEMKSIFRYEVLPQIKTLGEKMWQESFAVSSQDESMLVPYVNKLMRKYPSIYIKSRVQGAKKHIRIRITIYGPNQKQVKQAAQYLRGRR